MTPTAKTDVEFVTDLINIVLGTLNEVRDPEDVNAQSPVDGRTALHSAACKNSVATIEHLVASGANLDVKDYFHQQTALHKAAELNRGDSHLRSIQALVSSGAGIEIQDHSGRRPLHYLVGKANVTAVKSFLEYGPDVNAQDSQGEVPLVEAIRQGNVEVVRLLLEHGAKINSKSDQDGSTPLHWACHCGHEELIKLLVRAGADVNALDRVGFTPLKCALEFFAYTNRYVRPKGILSFLLKHADINAVDAQGRNILHSYTEVQSREILLAHIAKLSEINVPISPGLICKIAKRQEDSDYFKACKDELTKARMGKLKNSWVSYFHVLVQDKRRLQNYAGNPDLVEEFYSNANCLVTFPVYGEAIRRNIWRGRRRRRLFDESAVALSWFLNFLDPTHLATENILWRLKKKDFLLLCEASKKAQ